MSEVKFVTVKGKAYYAQVLGKPRTNYQKDGTEWTIDVVLEDKAEVRKLQDAGIGDRIRIAKETHPAAGEKYYKFTRKFREANDQYEQTKPPKVMDMHQKDWPQDKLIGNNSDVFVRFSVTPPGDKKFKSKVTLMGVMVEKHVPYESSGRGMFDEAFEEYDLEKPKDEDWSEAGKSDNDLTDEIPF